MDKIANLIAQMTLEEKAALCTGASAWTTTAIERLGIPEMLVSDGPHGLRRVEDVHAVGAPSLPATCFPTASCTASSWDTEVIRAVGKAIAEEAIALKADVVLGPGNNMKRSPVCGRNFEYFSEDPYLSGVLATHYIRAVQSKGVGVSLKHFAVNNQEYRRFSISAEVDERALHEIYLPAFEMAVKQGQPWTVMCAYNKINGTYASEHRWLLSDLLKKQWGFEGLVVSDWGAVHDRVAGIEAGLDLEMPGPKPHRVKAVVEAVRSGQLSEAKLDESVRRILRIVFMARAKPKGKPFDAKAHHALARQAAAEGMVLLKNNGILPLKRVGHIAVIGRSAKHPHFQGGGSSNINPTQVDIPFDEIQKYAPKATLSYSEGYPADLSSDAGLIKKAVKAAKAAQVALVFVALPSSIESEGYDRKHLNLTDQQVALIKAVSKAQPKTVVILNNGSAIAMGEWLDGVAGVLEAWMMGQAGGGAIADILFGKVNPSGKLTETFPLRLEDTPAFLNFPGENGRVHYGEGLFIGYRYYDSKGVPVQFPFGFGLSYTRFEYSNLQLKKRFKDGEGLKVSLDITNTGKVSGKEVVQLYVHHQKPRLLRPHKELKAFAKVELQPGETKTVKLKLDSRAFAYYDPAYKGWIAEGGEYEILLGASAADIRLSQVVTLQSTRELPSVLNQESTVREWLEDQRGKVVFEPMFKQMVDQMRQAFGMDGDQFIGMDMMGFVLEMPLRSILGFQEQMLPMTADEIVAGLLKQVKAV
jgi:beta-glucosidase